MKQIAITLLITVSWLGSSQAQTGVASSDTATVQSTAKKTSTPTTGGPPAWTILPTNATPTPSPKTSGGQDVVFMSSGLGGTWIQRTTTTPTTPTSTAATTESPAAELPASAPYTTGTSNVGGFTSPTFMPVTSAPLKFTGPAFASPKAALQDYTPVKFTSAKPTSVTFASPKATANSFAPVKFGSPKFTPVGFSSMSKSGR